MDIIKIKKGLDIPIGGKPEKRVVDARSIRCYAVKPADVIGMNPRLQVAEGDHVAAGQTVVADKNDERLALTSPVDGVVHAIVRGEKRKLLEVRIEQSASAAQPEPHKERNLKGSPCWWMLRERPFGTIANPDHSPKGIFVSMMDTNPLAPDMDLALNGRIGELEAGLKALAALAPLHVCLHPEQDQLAKEVNCGIEGCEIHFIEGPHPSGNVGTQIAAIAPIAKGKCVWTVGAQDVANIGRWMTTGLYRPERVISVGGPSARNPHHYRVVCGACVDQITDAQLMYADYPAMTCDRSGTRIISGSALSGTQIAPDGYLGTYDQQITLLPEGNLHEAFGWMMPNFNKFSFSKTFVSGWMNLVRPLLPKGALEGLETYRFNTNLNGGRRPLMFTGDMERVFPFDIYPMQLIKACIVGDMELQEKLGIYEVEPEDLALCEFIDPSKTDIQSIIREALEALRKEATA